MSETQKTHTPEEDKQAKYMDLTHYLRKAQDDARHGIESSPSWDAKKHVAYWGFMLDYLKEIAFAAGIPEEDYINGYNRRSEQLERQKNTPLGDYEELRADADANDSSKE